MTGALPAGETGGDATGEDGEAPARARRVEEVEAFCRTLGKIDLTFLAVRDQLYGGSWQEVEDDLHARLSGKPYIFKLATRIEEDLERIECLRSFEQANGVDLRQVASALDLDPLDD